MEVFLTIALNVISNGLSSMLGGWLEKEDVQEIEGIISAVVRDTAETFEWDGEPRLEEVCLFIDTPEIEELIKQLVSVHADQTKRSTIQQIQEQFTLLFNLYFGDVEADDARVNRLFGFLVTVTIKSLERGTEEGSLIAHELMSGFRHVQTLDYLSVIDNNLKFLLKREETPLSKIWEFEENLRSQTAKRYGLLIPTDFDKSHKIPIDDLYVLPHFICTSEAVVERVEPSRREIERVPIYFDEKLGLRGLLKRLTRIVVLGDPGAGKTTLTRKLCYSLCMRYEERLASNRRLTPIHITLRDYAKAKAKDGISIIEFIEKTANSSFQLPPPKDACRHLLLNGRALVIFDGLDEVLQKHERAIIVEDVESFANLYPTVPLIVTSRRVGYEQAPLNKAEFSVFEIQPFTDKQVFKYATNWFALDKQITNQERLDNVVAFMRESRSVTDLRSNPLMLSLMCNLYRGIGYIPGNRPELYEKCSLMLFERWDKDRGIDVQFEKYLRPAMMTIAHWIFSDQKLQAGVQESILIEKTTDYLEQYHESRDVAENVARSFVEYCRGRVWVFTEVGQGLYQFTHRTFLEYFTAFHLTRIHNRALDLINLLTPKIIEGEWDVVSQLAIQIKDKNSEGATDECVKYLMDLIYAREVDDPINILSFLIRLLEFAVPTYRLRVQIINELLSEIESIISTFRSRISTLEPVDLRLRAVRSLSRVNHENSKVVIDTFRSFLKTKLFEGNGPATTEKDRRWIAFVLCCSQLLHDIQPRTINDVDTFGVFDGVPEIPHYSWNDSETIASLYELGLVEPDDFIGYYGPKILFQTREFLSSHVYTFPTLLSQIFRYLSGDDLPLVYSNLLDSLSQLGINREDGTGLDETPVLGYDPMWCDQLNNFNSTIKMTDNQRFGVFVILAILLEVDSEATAKWIRRRKESLNFANFGLFDCVLARYFSSYEQNAEREIIKSGLKLSKATAIRSWINADYNLVS